MSRPKVEYQDRPDLAERVKRRGTNLRLLRERYELSGPQLALAAENMSTSYIYEIENGRVALASLRILDRLAKGFGMQPHVLLAELDREVMPCSPSAST